MNRSTKRYASRPWMLAALPEDPDPNAGGGAPKPTPPDPPAKTFSQEDVNRLTTEARDRGQRQAVKDIADKFGMTPDEALAKFTELQAAEAGRLTEVERREAAAADKEQKATQREAAAAERERAADITKALALAGASGDDLSDAAVLIRGTLDATADEAAITEAVTKLKERRAELFKAPSTDLTKTPPPRSDPGGPPPPGGRGGATKEATARQRMAQFGITASPART